MLTHHIFSTAIALSTLTPSFSYTCTFTHLQMSSAASPLSNALRRSSRLRTSPYFNGGSFAAPVITPQFLASSDRGALDDVGEPEAQEDQPKRKDDSSKPTKKTSSSKSKASSIAKASTTTERTQSFEPAWWGNILANPTHTTLSPAKSTPMKRKPINYPRVHTLILGTHPSIASLSKNQFYGHPQNSFWYLVGDALHFRRCDAVSPSTYKPYIYFYEHLRYGVEHVIEYEAQLERLVGHGFALWDIVRECERKDSLDRDINEESPNPIKEFCEGSISDRGGWGVKRIVIANGSTGAKFFVKHFKDWFEEESIGPLQNRVLSIGETETTTLYRVLQGPTEGVTDDLRVSVLSIGLCFVSSLHLHSFVPIAYTSKQRYFRLETPLAPLYKEWSKTDSRLAKIAAVIPGCHILCQDPMECMFSFICTSNNNIPRITKMLSSFRMHLQFMCTQRLTTLLPSVVLSLIHI